MWANTMAWSHVARGSIIWAVLAVLKVSKVGRQYVNWSLTMENPMWYHQSMDHYATVKTGLRLCASAWINPILLTWSPETLYIVLAGRIYDRKSSPMKLLEGMGGGRNPEVGLLLGNQDTAGSRYGYWRHRCCLRKSDVRLCPHCPPVNGHRTGSCWQGILGVVVLRLLLPATEMRAKGMGWCWMSGDKSNTKVSDKATPKRLLTTWSIFYFGCTTRLWHLSSQTRDWTWALGHESCCCYCC